MVTNPLSANNLHRYASFLTFLQNQIGNRRRPIFTARRGMRHALGASHSSRALVLGLLIGTALGIAIAVGAQHLKKPADAEIIATVNGEPILKTVIAAELIANQTASLNAGRPEFRDGQPVVAASIGGLVLKRLASGGGKPITLTRPEVEDWLIKDRSVAVTRGVDNAIQERVIHQTAKQKNLSALPDEINRRYAENIETVRTNTRLGGLNDQQVLAAVGVREAYLRRNIINVMLLEKLMVKDLETRNGHPVGPDDYGDVSQILIRVNATSPADADKAFQQALSKAADIASQIKSGKLKFEDAAKTSSDDESRINGGAIGVIVRGTQLTEVEKAAFSLPSGGVSEPVRSPQGWLIVRLNRSGKETTGPERFQVMRSYFQRNSRNYLMQLVQQARVVNKVIPKPLFGSSMPGTAGQRP